MGPWLTEVNNEKIPQTAFSLINFLIFANNGIEEVQTSFHITAYVSLRKSNKFIFAGDDSVKSRNSRSLYCLIYLLYFES